MSLTWSLSVLLFPVLLQLLWMSASSAGRTQPRTRDAGASPVGRGKFTTRDKLRCTWRSRESEEAVKLSIKCEKPGASDIRCSYDGRPSLCPSFRSHPQLFWKQVARALKRLQGKLCTDERALVKAGLCKRAPRESHFRLEAAIAVRGVADAAFTTRPVEASVPTACTRTHRQTADEYCSNTWASACTFFLTMLQMENC